IQIRPHLSRLSNPSQLSESTSELLHLSRLSGDPKARYWPMQVCSSSGGGAPLPPHTFMRSLAESRRAPHPSKAKESFARPSNPRKRTGASGAETDPLALAFSLKLDAAVSSCCLAISEHNRKCSSLPSGASNMSSKFQRLAIAVACCCLLAAPAASAGRRRAGEAALIDTLDALDSGGQFGALLSNYWSRLPLWLCGPTEIDSTTPPAWLPRKRQKLCKKNTPVYYANAGQLIADHSWDIFFPSRRLSLRFAAALLEEAAATIDAAASGDNQEEDGFDEKFSDDCIHEFYGRMGATSPASLHHLASLLADAMVRSEGRRDYYLTHQANCLYNLTELAQSRPASVDLSGDGSPLQRLLDKFCGRILVAAAAQEAAGFPVINRDLFMEQIGLCSASGYVAEFGQPSWHRAVLSWQRANGCYGAFPNELVARENFNPARYGNYRRKRSEGADGQRRLPLPPDIVALDALVGFTRQQVEHLLR
uniref:Peptidase_M13 domain-containing protein n=1 Tax=Macrostomum lignano TaxID=282301 RepID=A0A1I8JQ14_9PLAT